MTASRVSREKTILCVDDEQGVLDALNRLLRRMSYRVVLARNGEEASGVVQRERPDLILLDVHMPKMNGFSFLQWLRDNGMGEIPVVMLTGDQSDEATLKGYQEGIQYYINKPFNNDYVQNITKYLIGDLTEREREVLETQL
jgi:CheY-like chemotaxis protein